MASEEPTAEASAGSPALDSEEVLFNEYGVTVTHSMLIVGNNRWPTADLRVAQTYKEGRVYVLRLSSVYHRNIKACWSNDLTKIKRIEQAVRQSRAINNPDADVTHLAARLEADDYVGLPTATLAELRRKSVRDFLVNGAIAVVGILLTANSYVTADANGGKYFVFFGAILFGGYRALQALERYGKASAALAADTNVSMAKTLAAPVVDGLRAIDAAIDRIGASSDPDGGRAPTPNNQTHESGARGAGPQARGPEAAGRYCGRCGAPQARPGDRFCRSCGDEL
jgi:hypothetical protein